MSGLPKAARLAALFVALVVLAHALDRVAYERLVVSGVYDEDWGRMLRVMGYWPLWLAASIAIALHDWPLRARLGVRAALSRAWFLLLAVTASGIVGELLKLVFRRERPGAHDGAYFFRPWSERPLYNGGLALPSTHTIVAFGAAAGLARLFPRSAPVYYLLAAGCGLTRVLAHAHFVSDVVVAALAAWLVVAFVWKRWFADQHLVSKETSTM